MSERQSSLPQFTVTVHRSSPPYYTRNEFQGFLEEARTVTVHGLLMVQNTKNI